MNEMIFCQACGREIHRTARSCPACGARLAAPSRHKDKTVAALLALFLGTFGIHRFYLGQWWGLFYLFFSWTCLPALISVIECIVFLCTSQDNWDSRYNNPMLPSGNAAPAIIVLVCLAVLAVPGVGILAAIALPAYQDYNKRTWVSEGITAAGGLKAAETEYYSSYGKFPPSLEAAGIQFTNLPKAVASIDLDPQTHAIVITYNQMVNGKTLRIEPSVQNNSIVYTCYSTDMDSRILPSNCRH